MIEWGNLGFTSPITHRVLDLSGQPPNEVLIAGQPFNIEVKFKVPAALSPLIGNCDKFRLRAFAESQGPGQEVQVAELIVDGLAGGVTDYTAVMKVSPNPLLGEGQVYKGEYVSGLYHIVVVLQHLNGGMATVYSGNSDVEPSVFFRAP